MLTDSRSINQWFILDFFGFCSKRNFVWEQEINCILYWIAPVRMCICVNASQLFKSTQISFRKLHWLLYINVCSLSNIGCIVASVFRYYTFPLFHRFWILLRKREWAKSGERANSLVAWHSTHVYIVHTLPAHIHPHGVNNTKRTWMALAVSHGMYIAHSLDSLFYTFSHPIHLLRSFTNSLQHSSCAASNDNRSHTCDSMHSERI